MSPIYTIQKSIIVGHIYYTLYENEINIGKAIFDKQVTSESNTIHLKFIYIKPDKRGNNLSTILFNLVEKELKLNNNKKITLDAEEDTTRHNKLINLYKTIGYQIVGTERYIYKSDTLYRSIRMEKEL